MRLPPVLCGRTPCFVDFHPVYIGFGMFRTNCNKSMTALPIVPFVDGHGNVTRRFPPISPPIFPTATLFYCACCCFLPCVASQNRISPREIAELAGRCCLCWGSPIVPLRLRRSVALNTAKRQYYVGMRLKYLRRWSPQAIPLPTPSTPPF
jgi:hypothetical protein